MIMKKLDYYQCDFCIITGELEYIKKHEADCRDDPSKKRCGSCKHEEVSLDYGLYYVERCKAGADKDSDHIGDVRRGDKKCESYETKD
jgi:hypothetical protein